MSKPHENNLNEEPIELIEAVADSAAFCEQSLNIEDDIEAHKELSQAKKALYDYCNKMLNIPRIIKNAEKLKELEKKEKQWLAKNMITIDQNHLLMVQHGKISTGRAKELIEVDIQKQLEALEEDWTLAIMYNVDNVTWNRIKDALNALKKPKI